MSKLLLVTDNQTPDQLLLMVPDGYDETDIHEVAAKGQMGSIEIHEMILPEHFTADLRDMGIKEWREYWG